MNNQDVIDYVINTPNNTNPVILKQMLKEQDFENRPDWNQNNPAEPDYIKNKPTKLTEFENDLFYNDMELFQSLTYEDFAPVYMSDENGEQTEEVEYLYYIGDSYLEWFNSTDSIYFKCNYEVDGEVFSINYGESSVESGYLEEDTQYGFYIYDEGSGIEIATGVNYETDELDNKYSIRVPPVLKNIEIYKHNIKKIPIECLELNDVNNNIEEIQQIISVMDRKITYPYVIQPTNYDWFSNTIKEEKTIFAFNTTMKKELYEQLTKSNHNLYVKIGSNTILFNYRSYQTTEYAFKGFYSGGSYQSATDNYMIPMVHVITLRVVEGENGFNVGETVYLECKAIRIL